LEEIEKDVFFTTKSKLVKVSSHRNVMKENRDRVLSPTRKSESVMAVKCDDADFKENKPNPHVLKLLLE